ncbi:MAG: choice-of-anchor D domain-containing protein [Burkholderiales bacterium]
MPKLCISTARALAATIACIALSAHAADPIAGKALYLNTHASPLSCAASSCHGTDPAQGKNGIQNGKTGQAVLSAINGVSDMSLFRAGMPWAVTATEADDIAAYIANPNAGTPSPAIRLSTASLAFGGQQVLTPSAQMVVTVSNTGSADLALQTITVGGTHAADFARTGTCAPGGTLAAGGTCTIAMTFTPQTMGARSANVAITHNATGSPGSITLSGTGTAAPAAALGLSANTIAFGDQVQGTTSPSKSVTLSNSGSAPLTFSSLGVTGANASDFQIAGACAAGGTVAAGGSCTLNVAFAPGAIGSRAASITIASSATGSPHAVGLSGNGVAIGVPAAKLSPASVSFGNQIVGAPGSQQAVTLTNTGGAILNMTNFAVTGPGFAHNSSCGASLAPAASCTINVTFAPTAIGATAGSLTVATNATGSPHTVPLTGSGIMQPAGGVTEAQFRPRRLEFRGQSVNTTSSPKLATLTNTGTSDLNITDLKLSGRSAKDFAWTGNCPAVLAPKASCQISVTYTPTLARGRRAQLELISNANGRARIELSGVGVRAAGTTAPGDDRDDDD